MKVKKTILALILIIAAMAAVEITFRHFVAITSERPTFVSRNWIDKYWFPVNSMGFRDSEHFLNDLKGKKNIIIAGDSITAGYGIKDYQDRYPDILERKLGSGYQVINLSYPGWNIEDKVNAILHYPHIKEIKVIVYQMYFDDYMQYVIHYCGKPPVTKTDWVIPESGLYVLARKSYFINYVYWRLYEITFKYRKTLQSEYISYLDCAEKNRSKVLADGFEVLNDVIKLCKKNNIKFIILKIPHLELNGKIRENINNASKENNSLFVKDNIVIVDCIDEYNKYEVTELRVNMSDSHPNEKAHRMIADILYETLNKLNL
jgi:lysophospholipase L1-like esterase